MALFFGLVALITEFLVAVAGTGIGVYLAFLADNYRERQSEKQDTKRVLNLLVYELTKNLAILDVMKEGITENNLDEAVLEYVVPFEHLSSSIYEGISNKMGLLTDNELLFWVDRAYHNFLVFEEVVSVYQNHLLTTAIQPEGEIKKNLLQLVKEDHDAIVGHLTQSEKGNDMFSITKSAISALNSAINALD